MALRKLLLLVGIFFIQGVLIQHYGKICGLDLLQPSTWLVYIFTYGSYICRMLNWLNYILAKMSDHSLSILFSRF